MMLVSSMPGPRAYRARKRKEMSMRSDRESICANACEAHVHICQPQMDLEACQGRSRRDFNSPHRRPRVRPGARAVRAGAGETSTAATAATSCWMVVPVSRIPACMLHVFQSCTRSSRHRIERAHVRPLRTGVGKTPSAYGDCEEAMLRWLSGENTHYYGPSTDTRVPEIHNGHIFSDTLLTHLSAWDR